jgi:hypothetical protein
MDNPDKVQIHYLTQQLTAEKTRADAAERARDEVGIQLAAAQERLRLAMACVSAFRVYRRSMDEHGEASADMWRAMMDALDAVPGDALAHPTRHLEALGIDTDRVKGGE